ncbi:MAG: pantoate--beta-alanine ligase [Candidatus Eutrophobiaceae bacterium]
MKIASNIAELRAELQELRQAGKQIALVPTMGNLHKGHIALVERFGQLSNAAVVATIFVNPTQFIAGEDYSSYPRSLDRDLAMLRAASVSLTFIPTAQEMYPPTCGAPTEVIVHGLEDILCGRFRTGHFRGVATVVSKLFHLIEPDHAIFGEKDYQQLALIRRLVIELNFPVKVHSHPIVREADGLAMSSRNQYLSADERRQASSLYQALQDIANALPADLQTMRGLCAKAGKFLESRGFKPEYVEIRDAQTLGELSENFNKNNCTAILAAAWLGQARLIDNLLVR